MLRRLTREICITHGCDCWSIAALLLFLVTACGDRNGFPRQSLERGGDGVAFVEDGSCRNCHEDQWQAWTGSHHDLAMQRATEETVLGDFNDAAFAHFDVTTRFFRRNGDFFVNAEGPTGVMQDYEVLYTFGVEPLQQYLVAFPGGRLQALTVAWDTRREEWFDLYQDERIMPGAPLHWTGRLLRWNGRCAECHSTDVRVAFDAGSDSYRTTWAAEDVRCQACHGPGADHLVWADFVSRIETADTTTGQRGLVVDFRSDGAGAQLTNCARCHSLRSRASPEDAHGRSFYDDFSLSLLREGLYHPDGQILGEVYVAGSFMQSLMHRRGVTCTNCHDPHSTSIVVQGNDLCTRCHQQDPPPTFPTLTASVYDSPEHHHHEAGSAGSMCVECHMPAQTFMVVDPRRDHSLRIPRPDLSVSLGTPNACTMCHTERSDEWAVEAIDDWFGTPARPRHYGDAIAAGRTGGADAADQLAQLVADTSQPAIARATALDLLGGYRDRDAIVAVASALSDMDPLVRLAAVNGLEQLPPASRPAVLARLLGDSIASIRIAAARMLAVAESQMTDAGQLAQLRRALNAYEQTQLAQADQPEALQNLGDMHAARGQVSQAEQWYSAAMRLDSTFVPARVNLAMLYNQLGRNAEAERLLRQSISLAPDFGELHYSLGLLLAEQQRIAEAISELSLAATALPGRPRISYNLGLALQQVGRTGEAETALLHAHQSAPRDPDFVNGLAFFYRETGRWTESVSYARLLIELLPDQDGPKRLLDQIQAERDGR